MWHCLKRRWWLWLGVLLAGTLGLILVWSLAESEPDLRGKPLKEWVELAVLGDRHQANATLHKALRNADPALKARIERELDRFVRKCLKAKYDALQSQYSGLRTRLPQFLARLMPAWPDPRRRRNLALFWLCVQSDYDPDRPALLDRCLPTLCNLARNDSAQNTRTLASIAVGMGTYSPQALEIMLRALRSNDRESIEAGARWFYRYPVDADHVVPLLAKGFENPVTRPDCAMTLRVYGPRAALAVESLRRFANHKDPQISSVAVWVLESADPKAGEATKSTLP